MTFDDPFLLNDADALTEQCLIEVPVATTTQADAWGLGATSPPSSVTYSVQCMEVPQRVYVDRETGLEVAVSLGLEVLDAQGIVSPECRIQYRGTRYQIKSVIAPVQHTVKRVLLDEIG